MSWCGPFQNENHNFTEHNSVRCDCWPVSSWLGHISCCLHLFSELLRLMLCQFSLSHSMIEMPLRLYDRALVTTIYRCPLGGEGNHSLRTEGWGSFLSDILWEDSVAIHCTGHQGWPHFTVSQWPLPSTHLSFFMHFFSLEISLSDAKRNCCKAIKD